MNIAEIIVTYSISWWIVLFMILPFGNQPSPSPVPGQVPSAPEKPRIRKKLALTTCLAFIPTLGMWLTQSAWAATYQARSDCGVITPYVPPADIHVQANQGIAPADSAANPYAASLSEVHIPLEIPLSNYRNLNNGNADFAPTNLQPGQVRVNTVTGNVHLNDTPIDPQAVHQQDCLDRQGGSSMLSTK